MKYDAFISYRHLERDMYVAKKVHKGLETVRIPRKLQKELGRKKINRVFRDQEELPVVGDLGINIEAALLVSDFLVVICSPETKESKWVMKEIDTFIKIHGRKKILPVLVDGEPEESFPPQLLTDEEGRKVEPLAADVRGTTKKEVDKKLKVEILRVAAAIIGVEFDDLRQRQRERQIKRNMSIVLGVAAVSLVFATFSAYNFARINEEYQQKLINESKVLAAKSQDVFETGDTKTAALIAMEGMPKDGERPLVPESLYALSMALGVYDKSTMLANDTLIHTDYAVEKICTTSESDIIAILDANGNVYVWNLNRGKMLYEIQAEINNGIKTEVLDICLTDDASTVCVIYDDAVRGYDNSGEMVYEYQPEQYLLGAAVSEYKNCVVLEYAQNGEDYYPDTIAILNPVDGTEQAIYHSETEAPYSDVVTFDTTGSVIAVGHLVASDVDNYVSVYCPLEESNYRKLPVEKEATISMGFAFTDSYGLMVTSASQDDDINGDVISATVQYFNLVDGASQWSTKLDYYMTDYIDGSYQIEPFDDGSSETFTLSAISAGRKIYIVDNRTGELLDQVNSDSYISQILTGGENLVLMTLSGNFRTYTYSQGLTNPFYEQTIANEVTKFGFTETRLAVCGDSDSEVRVYYSDDMQRYDKCIIIDGHSKDGVCSPDGEYYMIASSPEDGSEEILYTIYDTNSYNEVGTFTTQTTFFTGIQFIDNDTLFVPTVDYKFVFYSVEKQKKDVMEIDVHGAEDVGEAISENKKYVAVFSYDFVDVYDLETRELCHHKELSTDIALCIVSSTGDMVYTVDERGTIRIENLADDTERTIDLDYEIISFEVSPDDKYMALNCDDNTLRIINIDTEKEETSFDYIADVDGYMSFSDDGKYIYTQSSNNYFRIYDIEDEQMVLVSDAITSKIRRTDYDEATGVLAVTTTRDMYLIDENAVGLLAYIDSGRIFVPEKGLIISGTGSEILIFHYKDAEELLEEAHRRYGDQELGDEQKLLYGIGVE